MATNDDAAADRAATAEPGRPTAAAAARAAADEGDSAAGAVSCAYEASARSSSARSAGKTGQDRAGTVWVGCSRNNRERVQSEVLSISQFLENIVHILPITESNVCVFCV